MNKTVVMLETAQEQFVGDLTLDEFQAASPQNTEEAVTDRSFLLTCQYPRWILQGGTINAGERFIVRDYGGSIDMGWGTQRAVNVFGEHRDTAAVCGEAGSTFPRGSGWSRHCLVMGIQFERDGQFVVRAYRSTHDQPWGSSVMKRPEAYYFTARESGTAVCLFNDQDENNSGQMWGEVFVMSVFTHFERTKVMTRDWHDKYGFDPEIRRFTSRK